LGEGAAACGGKAVFGAGDAAFEKLDTRDVLRLFEFAGVNAQVAVGGFEHALEIVETERIVGGEGTDDAEANAFVNEAVEFGEFRSPSESFLARARFGLGVARVLDLGWKSFSHRGFNLRAFGR